MKKYKLIKEYPGSPKLGYVDDLNKTGHNNKGLCVQPMYDKNPEFWEEVIEKDYEILSILIRRSDKHQQKIVTNDESEDYIRSLINCDGNSIHSVKRLSDSEIFTIGDDVLSKTCGVPNKILSIEITNNKIRLYPRNSFYNLEDILKAKQPLFTTEDGVDIFEGDEFYYVSLEFKIYDRIVTNDYLKLEIYKDFSTKGKAEEWIFKNKPCLSYNDILDCRYTSGEISLNKITGLVKERLNEY